MATCIPETSLLIVLDGSLPLLPSPSPSERREVDQSCLPELVVQAAGGHLQRSPGPLHACTCTARGAAGEEDDDARWRAELDSHLARVEEREIVRHVHNKISVDELAARAVSVSSPEVKLRLSPKNSSDGISSDLPDGLPYSQSPDPRFRNFNRKKPLT